MKDRHSGAVFSDVVPEKGVTPYAVRTMVDHIKVLGYPKVKLRSDGERPIRALLEEVGRELKREGVTVVPDTTPVGDSQAGGLQESTVQQFKNRCRAL